MANNRLVTICFLWEYLNKCILADFDITFPASGSQERNGEGGEIVLETPPTCLAVDFLIEKVHYLAPEMVTQFFFFLNKNSKYYFGNPENKHVRKSLGRTSLMG